MPIREPDRKEIRSVLKQFTGDALRVLALGMRTGPARAEERDLIFVGMAGMADPVRPETKGAVEEFKRAGVRTRYLRVGQIGYRLCRCQGAGDRFTATGMHVRRGAAEYG